jgi:hypothetical protein
MAIKAKIIAELLLAAVASQVMAGDYVTLQSRPRISVYHLLYQRNIAA